MMKHKLFFSLFVILASQANLLNAEAYLCGLTVNKKKVFVTIDNAKGFRSLDNLKVNIGPKIASVTCVPVTSGSGMGAKWMMNSLKEDGRAWPFSDAEEAKAQLLKKIAEAS